MADVLYGADLGSVATDLYGNIYADLNLTVYSDKQGSNVFTLTKKVGPNFGVGSGTGGVVQMDTLGRVMFYAQDTDSTLWIKNGPNYWAINPVSISELVQGRIAAALSGREMVTDSLEQRITSVEGKIGSLQTNTARSWQMWRGRMSALKTTTTLNYTSLTFASPITSPTTFGVNLNNDAVSVSLAGWYRVSLRAGFIPNAAGFRSTLIVLNSGATTLNSATVPTTITAEDDRPAATGIATTTSVSEDFYLLPSDSILFVVRQNSGGNLDVNNGRHLTSASLEYLGTA